MAAFCTPALETGAAISYLSLSSFNLLVAVVARELLGLRFPDPTLNQPAGGSRFGFDFVRQVFLQCPARLVSLLSCGSSMPADKLEPDAPRG